MAMTMYEVGMATRLRCVKCNNATYACFVLCVLISCLITTLRRQILFTRRSSRKRSLCAIQLSLLHEVHI